MPFENYENYIDMSQVVTPVVETKKYVIRLELASPLITDFTQTHVLGRTFKGSYFEGKDFNYIQDIQEVIAENKDKILKKKAHAAFTFLTIGKLSVVLGLEIHKDEGPENISRFIGNFFSRSLFHNKKWFLIANTPNHLFNVKELREYNG
jgi:hypothetical protein